MSKLDEAFMEFVGREYGSDTQRKIAEYGIGVDKRIRDEENAFKAGAKWLLAEARKVADEYDHGDYWIEDLRKLVEG